MLRKFCAIERCYDLSLTSLPCSSNQWKHLRIQWNQVWLLTNDMRGRDVPTPPDVLGLPIWFQGIPSPQGFQQFLIENGEV